MTPAAPAARNAVRGTRPGPRAVVGVLLAALTLICLPAAASAATLCSGATSARPARVGALLGIVRPRGLTRRGCAATSAAESPYSSGATPPLLDHGGPVMATPDVGSQVVVTPVYWAPAGYQFTDSYKAIIDDYIANLAADSGRTTNVFASLTQYAGSNGAISYHLVAGAPIDDTTPFPTSAGCTPDGGSIYSDGSGYSACIDDDELRTETANVLAAHNLTSDLGHLYAVFLPRGVESCSYADGDPNQACTINYTASSAYCAYHSSFGTDGSSVYAAMPFPVYGSATGATCSSDGSGLGLQAPNGDPDADTEISPLSHEMAEAISDPHGDAWLDSSGYENGDECAYIYGTPQGGSPGALWNQTINGGHYLTQEEFSNIDYVAGQAGCVQESQQPPTVASVSPARGPLAGGQTITLTGTDLTAATTVRFGTIAVQPLTVPSSTKLSVRTPAYVAGTVDLTVTTPAGTSPVVPADRYTYAAAPTVSTVSPARGPLAGGQTITITGTDLTGATTVRFGTTAVRPLTVLSSTKLTVRTPAHVAGTVDLTVSTPDGTSRPNTADRFTYVRAPRVLSVSPRHGSWRGGQRVTITGTGFNGATSVRFGGAKARWMRVLSSTKIILRAPAHARGRVDVIVTTPGGPSRLSTSDRYRFI